jgi:hypothetical protein
LIGKNMKKIILIILSFSILAASMGCAGSNTGESPSPETSATLSTIHFTFDENEEQPQWEGDYMGLIPPGLTPELFAPGFISTDDNVEFAGVFTPDGNEFYFTRRISGKSSIWYTYKDEKGWSDTAPAPFSSVYFEFEPFITTNGKYLFYGLARHEPGMTANAQVPIWVLVRDADGWSEPRFFNAPINEGFAMYVTLAHNGNLYYTGEDGIYVSRYDDGEYLTPERIGPGAHPFIAPDESYMLFDDTRSDTKGVSDFYIRFLLKDGKWSDGIWLGDTINSEYEERAPYITPDGKYLFFSRFEGESVGNIYWMDATFLQEFEN